MARALRKTLRQKKSRRLRIAGWAIVLAGGLVALMQARAGELGAVFYLNLAVAETGDRIVFALSEHHTQAIDTAGVEDMERIRTLIEEKRDKTIQRIGSNLFHKGDRV